MNDERSALTWSYLILKVKQSWCSPVLRCETTWKDQSAKITETKWAGRQCLVPLSLLSWQTGKTKTMILKKKKGQNNSFQCVFLLQQDFGVFSPFLAEVPLHKASPIPMSLLSPSVTICVCLKYWHMKFRDMDHFSRKVLEILWEWKKSSHWSYEFILEDPKLSPSRSAQTFMLALHFNIYVAP